MNCKDLFDLTRHILAGGDKTARPGVRSRQWGQADLLAETMRKLEPMLRTWGELPILRPLSAAAIDF